MKVNLNFKQILIEDKEDDESIEERLRRYAATFDKECYPVTDIQKHFHSERTIPYPNMDPVFAFKKFQELSKEYQKRLILGTGLDRHREKSNVEVGQTWIKPIPSSKPEIRVVLGDLEQSYSQVETMARDLSNILVVYTSCEKKNQYVDGVPQEANIVKGLTSEQINNATLYPIEVETTRALYPFIGGSNVTVRDSMYADLTADLKYTGKDQDLRQGTQTAVILYLMDRLASQKPALAVPIQPELIALYNRYKHKDMPVKQIMYKFSYTKYRLIKGPVSYNDVWMSFLKNRQHTGSGKDGIFSGYSLMDAPPGLAKNLEEAFDVVNCARHFGYSAVMVHKPNSVLANILVSSGLYVYCTTLGRKVQADLDPVGLYYRGSLKTMIWLGASQRPPEMKHDRVQPPEVVTFHDADTFSYEFIPEKAEASRYYLPSMKSAQGLCIKTNLDVSKRFLTTVEALLERFQTAIFTRTQYIFTRMTFAHVDPLRSFFLHTIILSRTRDGEEITPDFLQITKDYVDVQLKEEDRLAYEKIPILPNFGVDQTRHAAVEDVEDQATRGYVDDLQNQVMAIVEKLSNRAIKEMILRESFAPLKIKDPNLSQLYGVLSRYNFFAPIIARYYPREAKVHPSGVVEILANWTAVAQKLGLKRKDTSLPPAPITIQQPPEIPVTKQITSIYEATPAVKIKEIRI